MFDKKDLHTMVNKAELKELRISINDELSDLEYRMIKLESAILACGSKFGKLKNTLELNRLQEQYKWFSDRLAEVSEAISTHDTLDEIFYALPDKL